MSTLNSNLFYLLLLYGICECLNPKQDKVVLFVYLRSMRADNFLNKVKTIIIYQVQILK